MSAPTQTLGAGLAEKRSEVNHCDILQSVFDSLGNGTINRLSVIDATPMQETGSHNAHLRLSEMRKSCQSPTKLIANAVSL